MSKTKVITLSILITLMLVPYAYARTESFSIASNIIKRFDKETKALLPKSLNKEEESAFTKLSKDRKKETLSTIKSLRHTQGPSPKRFTRLLKIIDRHTANHIKEVDKLGTLLEGENKTQVEDMSLKLQELRNDLLKELRSTSYSEGKPLNLNKPEPVLDRSPYEERPGDTRGLYDR